MTRTTVEKSEFLPCVVDGIDCLICDVPGLCDSKDSTFTNLTHQTIAEVDLVLWASPIDRAFLTDHEVTEFKRVQTTIETLATTRGLGIQLAIILTKCDIDLGDTTDTADMSYAANYQHIKELFPDNIVMPFNAFGMIMNNSESSEELRRHTAQNGPQTSHNIELKLAQFYAQRAEFREAATVKQLLTDGVNKTSELLIVSGCERRFCQKNNGYYYSNPSQQTTVFVTQKCSGFTHYSDSGYRYCPKYHTNDFLQIILSEKLHFQQFVENIVKLFNTATYTKTINVIMDFLFYEGSKNELACWADETLQPSPLMFVINGLADCMIEKNLRFNASKCDWQKYAKNNNMYQNATRFILLFAGIPWNIKLRYYALVAAENVDYYSAKPFEFPRKCKTAREFTFQHNLCSPASIHHYKKIDNFLFDNEEDYNKVFKTIERVNKTRKFYTNNFVFRNSLDPAYLSTKFLNHVREIRRQIFGDAEDNVDNAVLLAAWPDYGWLWVPIE